MVENIQFLLEHGGIAAWIIFGVTIILILVGTEKLFYLFFVLSFQTEAALNRVRESVLNRKYTEAIQICSSYSRAPEVGVIKSGLVAVENGREAMKSALGAAVLDISRKCESRISYLALIASASTLLGLFGTILGLIKTFASLSQVDPSEKAKALGIGISEAMYATAWGLAVGLAAMVIHTLCVSKTDAIVSRSQDAGLKLVTWIEQSERSKSRA